MASEKIQIINPDRFKPRLYADLYIPSWVNGYSIAMEYIHNWFLSRFPKGYFKTVHIIGKNMFDDFRRFEFGEYAKREKPAVSFGAQIQYDYNFDNIDLHQLGIDGFIKRTNYQKSFFKDPLKKLYLGIVPEAMMINFTIRVRVDTKAEQLDLFKRMELMFRVGCTETVDTDMDFHVPYDLMSNVARDAGFEINDDNVIIQPYDFLEYVNKHSQIPFLYKLRYINGKYEYFIRMNNMPFYLDTRNQLDVDEGEQEGQTSTNYHIEMQVGTRVPVPKFYVYYAEGKDHYDIISDQASVNVYSMKVWDIPEINSKGWVQYGTSNYVKDTDEKYVKEIDILELFTAPVDIRVDISLDDLITDSIKSGISPSSFIDIQLYTNDMMVTGKLPITLDWENRKIVLPDNVKDNYFYIVIYTELGYINSKIIDINNVYKNRITRSKRTQIDRSEDTFSYDPIIETENKNEV